MPWRHLPEWITHLPDWLRWMAGFLTMLGAAGVGAMAKVADDVKTGNRDKFWTKTLFLEVPAVAMMALMCWGITEHYSFSSGASVAIAAFLGWAGPKTIEAIIALKLPKSWRK